MPATTTSFLLKLRIQAFELDACIVGRELPVDNGPGCIAAIRPRVGLAAQGVDVVDAPIETLLGEDAQFDLGAIEPTAVFGGVVNLQAVQESTRFLRWECLVQ